MAKDKLQGREQELIDFLKAGQLTYFQIAKEISLYNRLTSSRQAVCAFAKKHKLRRKDLGIVKIGHKSGQKVKPDKSLYKMQGFYRVVLQNGTYKMEHRILVEERLGRKLSKSEVIHHLNGIKSDNRDENLVVTSRKVHSNIHVSQYRDYISALQSRIWELESKLDVRSSPIQNLTKKLDNCLSLVVCLN